MPAYCRCVCHHAMLGDLRDAQHRECASAVEYFAADDHLCIPPLVDLRDQLEGWLASGCHCVNHHALLPAPRPKYKPPMTWRPEDDE